MGSYTEVRYSKIPHKRTVVGGGGGGGGSG